MSFFLYWSRETYRINMHTDLFVYSICLTFYIDLIFRHRTFSTDLFVYYLFLAFYIDLKFLHRTFYRCIRLLCTSHFLYWSDLSTPNFLYRSICFPYMSHFLYWSGLLHSTFYTDLFVYSICLTFYIDLERHTELTYIQMYLSTQYVSFSILIWSFYTELSV